MPIIDLLIPPTYKVLIVTDGVIDSQDYGTSPVFGTFGTEIPGLGVPESEHPYPYFGLSHFQQVLKDFGTPPIPEAFRFSFIEVTLAHRQEDPNFPGSNNPIVINNFCFDNKAVPLEDFNVIFLIGMISGTEDWPELKVTSSFPYISSTEVSAIEAFMDAGGGVFAVGDHQDIGAPMCGSIARVSSMRYWTSASGGPGKTDGTRVDTVPSISDQDALGAPIPTSGPPVQSLFETQSRAVPAPLETLYTPSRPEAMRSGELTIHPVFDLGDGRYLSHLPAHMHEGEVRTPERWERPQFPGLSMIEQLDNQAAPEPEVIATGYSLGLKSLCLLSPYNNNPVTGLDVSLPVYLGYSEAGFSGANEASFSGGYGAVAAYDGRSRGVGRIVTESTFHHLIDINILGDRDFPKIAQSGQLAGYPDILKKLEPMGVGYQNSPYLRDFEQYYRNLVVWLADEAATKIFWFEALPIRLNLHEGVAQLVEKSVEASTADEVRHVGRMSVETLEMFHLPKGILIDMLATVLDHEILPPWFAGRTGGRPTFTVDTATLLLEATLGSMTWHTSDLLKAAESANEAQAREQLRASSQKGMRHGIQMALDFITRKEHSGASLVATLQQSLKERTVLLPPDPDSTTDEARSRSERIHPVER